MKKLDIMNMREDEEWRLVNGKVQRVEKVKVVGPVVQNSIKEIKIIESKKKSTYGKRQKRFRKEI